jgi:hypothetical protein
MFYCHGDSGHGTPYVTVLLTAAFDTFLFLLRGELSMSVMYKEPHGIYIALGTETVKTN